MSKRGRKPGVVEVGRLMLPKRLRAMRGAVAWKDEVNEPGDGLVAMYVRMMRKEMSNFDREWREEERLWGEQCRKVREARAVRRAESRGDGNVGEVEVRKKWVVGDRGAEAALGLVDKLLKEFEPGGE